MIRIAFPLVLLLSSTLPAQEKKADEAAFRGKWKLVSGKFNGKAYDLPKDSQRGTNFTEKEVMTFDGQRVGRTLNYTLDATANPKQIDLTLAKTDQKSQGIYTLDGDTLTLCYAEPGAARPTKLESKEGDRTFLLLFKRIKE
ncbi:MAG: TIGR03067 domain-containing protein [Planctomycetia bacterium]|nr:TIGR03067 domain-containing protein [Planctomycetia bacterium]